MFLADHNLAGLLAELDNPHSTGQYLQVRGSAARALGDLGDPSAVPRLLEHLDDESEMMRMHVLGALGRIGSKDALPAIVERLNDPSLDTRMAAALALETMDARETIPVLRRTLLTNDDDDVRWYVAKALASMGDRTPANVVAEVLRDLPWWAWARRGQWKAVAETLKNHGQGGA